MSCSWCEGRLAPLLDGELTGRERALVERHTSNCIRCAQLLGELRVIDGLLLTSRKVELGPTFTFATMAEVHDRPAPARCGTPFVALVVCYVTAAWLLVLAALVLAPFDLRSFALRSFDTARTLFDALAGPWHVVARFFGWTLAANVLLAFALVALIYRMRPLIAERLRS